MMSYLLARSIATCQPLNSVRDCCLMDFSPFVYENLQALKTDNRNAVSSKTDDYTDMDGPRDETCTIAGGIEGFSTQKTTMHESSTLVKPKI